eukprot:121029-Amphidinium_carterae.1
MMMMMMMMMMTMMTTTTTTGGGEVSGSEPLQYRRYQKKLDSLERKLGAKSGTKGLRQTAPQVGGANR